TRLERERVPGAGRAVHSEDEVSRARRGDGRSSVHFKTIDEAAMEKKGRLSIRLSACHNGGGAADVKEVELCYLHRGASLCPLDGSVDRDGVLVGTSTRPEYPRRYLDVLSVRSWKDDDRDRIARHRCHHCCLRQCGFDRCEEYARICARRPRLRDKQR